MRTIVILNGGFEIVVDASVDGLRDVVVFVPVHVVLGIAEDFDVVRVFGWIGRGGHVLVGGGIRTA